MNLIDRIEELKTTVPSIKILRAHLAIEGFKDSEVNSAIKEAGLVTKKTSFASEFYAWLAESERGKDEVELYIMDPKWGGEIDKKGLTNIQRHLSHYSNIADLARTIWTKG